MIRCVTLAVAALAALPALAQAPRNFSAQALRGELVIVQPPQALLNGQPVQLAPGARIRDQNNLVQLSGSLVNQRFVVNYTRDLSGHLLDVWLLTPEERARQPWPTSAAQAATWRFNAAAQTWSKP
jgi:hypothetical protein